MERVKLYKGDCIDVMRGFDDKCIDLTVTSPPYDNLRTYKDTCVWDFDVFKQAANELYRITKDGGVVVWVVGDATINGSETGTSFKQALYFKDIGFNLHDTMIWQKDTLNFPDVTRYGQCFEYMFILSKGKPKCVNKICDRINKWANTSVHGTSRNSDGATFRKCNHNKTYVKEYGERFNVWLQAGEKNNVFNHPAVFPEKLAYDHIISWSNEGDLVLDCFMGSGTTGKMSLKANRRFIGIEKVDEYFEVAKRRIWKEEQMLSLF